MHCETQIDYCNPSPCLNGAHCINEGYFDYRCDCTPFNSHYTGRNCEIFNYCLGHPCLNGGKCVNTNSSYVCKCPQGFIGVDCEHQIDYCDPNPCLNDGVCHKWGFFNYKCTCSENFAGQNCEISNFCKVNDVQLCLNGGICKPTQTSYECECAEQFTGKNCEIEVNPCLSQSKSCLNGGTCVPCNDKVNCKQGQYTCNCSNGYGGNSCEAYTSFANCFRYCRRPKQCSAKNSLYYCQ